MNSLYNAFLASVKKHSKLCALRYIKNNQYHKITYQELSDAVNSISTWLKKAGVKEGDRIGIISYNRPEWVMADLAILKLGAIVVPMYHMPEHFLPIQQVEYILNDAQIKILFVENIQIYTHIKNIRDKIPHLEIIVIFDAPETQKNSFIKFEELRKTPPEHTECNNISLDSIATIVYTSGTTGEPKGVMLSHGNILSNANTAAKKFHFTSDDVVISYLPLAHMFERTCNYYTVLFNGGTIGYAQNLSTAAQDAEIIKPTVVLATPRVIEKIYEKALQKVQGHSPLRRALVYSAIKNLNERANLKYKKQIVPLWLSIKCSILNWLVGRKFRKIGGGKIRAIVVGGAPLNRKIAKIVYVLGFNIVEGYGLTETSPCICCCTVEDNRLGTVGKPFDDVEVKIAENGEILVRGPNVMKGYYNKPEETAKVIDSEGWFHTGDEGKFDNYGNLIITGRIKEILVTSGGKKVAPAPIEARLSSSTYIEQAVLCGDQKKYISALIVPNREVIENYAREEKIEFSNYEELLRNKKIINIINHVVEEVNSSLASYEQIKKFRLIPNSFTVDSGLLTPTLKIRRKKISETYKQEIESMYET
ncbi:MAG: AMP-dependent synthetase/ligase [bacterium]